MEIKKGRGERQAEGEIFQEFAFIYCTNNPTLNEEKKKYIDRLSVPKGCLVSYIDVIDAPSMCAGYNAAMRTSKAKYKIYLHQDVYLLNRWFLFQLLEIFGEDEQIGMIGMVGTPRLADCAIMWTGEVVGSQYLPEEDADVWKEEKREIRGDAPCDWEQVQAVDGFLMVTSKDLPWREDLFDGFDFYDVSQCMEFRKAGYQIVVPGQEVPWCVHDDGRILTLYQYNRYRKIFLREYKDDLVHECEKEEGR